MNAQLNCVRVFFVLIDDEFSSVLIFDYFEKSQKIVVYLFIFRKSAKMNQKNSISLRKKLLNLSFRMISFFVKIRRMFFWDELLMISKNNNWFWNNFTTKMIIATKKKHIKELLINIDEIIFTKQLIVDSLRWKSTRRTVRS